MMSAHHGHRDAEIWNFVQQKVKIIKDPIGRADEGGKPIGHDTHNLFVKDKKSKQLFLITVRQQQAVDLKKCAEALAVKELRLARKEDLENILGCSKGCVSCLNLKYDTEESVHWVLDQKLIDGSMPQWCLCVGCEDAVRHEQHNIATMSVMPDIVYWTGNHWNSKTVIDFENYKMVGTPKISANKNDAPSKIVETKKPTEKPAKTDNSVKHSKEDDKNRLFTVQHEKDTVFAQGFQNYRAEHQKYADDWLFTVKPVKETIFARAFTKAGLS